MNVQGRITISWHVRRVPQCGDSFSLFSPGFPRFFPTFPTANDIYISKETKTPQKGKRTKRWKQKVEQKKNIKRTNWLSFCRPFSQRRLSTNTHTSLPLRTHTTHVFTYMWTLPVAERNHLIAVSMWNNWIWNKNVPFLLGPDHLTSPREFSWDSGLCVLA